MTRIIRFNYPVNDIRTNTWIGERMARLNNFYDFKVAWCKICDQGWVTIVKDIVTNQYSVMCEECETEWDHPLHAQLEINSKASEHQVMTPSAEEIQQIEWAEYIIKN